MRFLVLDSRIIDRTTGARLTIGKVVKHPKNPLFVEDKPWEDRFDNLYANVCFDEQDGVYKCWYSPFINYSEHEMGVCYAVSQDGTCWEKPELGLVEFGGHKRNNLVLRRAHGAGVFKDSIEPDPARRFKMFFRDDSYPAKCKNAVAFSPDGLHWTKVSCPQINAEGDTHNNAFWAPEIGKYVGITRLWGRQPCIRQVGRTESPDFVNWTRAQVVLEGQEPRYQTYAMPVFRYANVYLGLVMIYDTNEDRTHCELTWSPDTVWWHRICPGTPFIANSQEKGDYDWGCVYAAAIPILLKNEIRIYYGGSNGLHFGQREGFLCLATLRPDGFAGYEPMSAETTAVITTKPLDCIGKALFISADVQDGGSVRVVLSDERGNEMTSSNPITRTVSDGQVTWNHNWDFSTIRRKKIQLNFMLSKAKLYSFSFGPVHA